MIMGEDEAFLFFSLIFWWGGKSEQYTLFMRVTHFCSLLVAGSVGNVLEPLTPVSKVPAGAMEARTAFKKGVSAGGRASASIFITEGKG